MWKLAPIVVAAAVVTLAPARASADFGTPRHGFGIGLGRGAAASGVSGKLMAGPGACQGVVGVWGSGTDAGHYVRVSGIALSLDYLFEMPTLVSSPYFNIDWDFGLGGGVGVATGGGTPGVAASAIAGLEFNFTRAPVDVALEYRPTIGFLPGFGSGLIGCTAHVRLWF